jgi:hypothetical protein
VVGSDRPLQGDFIGAAVATPVSRKRPLYISGDFISDRGNLIFA